jgi:hypothetical protein
MRLTGKVVAALPVLILLTIAARPAAAQDYKFEKTSDAPPAGISPAVQGLLGSDALKVTGPDGFYCELWLRKSVPAAAKPDTELGVTFGTIAVGTLVGVIQFPAEMIDYRAQHIHPGVYTLRYALMPTDGNHMGQAPQRDFLLASPVAVDTDPATVTFDQAVALSAKTTGTKHSSVWSLGPPYDSTAPSIVYDQESQVWDLEFSLTIEGTGPTPMALVVVGHTSGG